MPLRRFRSDGAMTKAAKSLFALFCLAVSLSPTSIMAQPTRGVTVQDNAPNPEIQFSRLRGSSSRIASSEDDTLLVTGGKNSATVWDAKTLSTLREFRG